MRGTTTRCSTLPVPSRHRHHHHARTERGPLRLGACCRQFPFLASFSSKSKARGNQTERSKDKTREVPPPLPCLPPGPPVHVGVVELQVGGVEALGPLIRSEKEQLKARKVATSAPSPRFFRLQHTVLVALSVRTSVALVPFAICSSHFQGGSSLCPRKNGATRPLFESISALQCLVGFVWFLPSAAPFGSSLRVLGVTRSSPHPTTLSAHPPPG